MVLSSCIKDNFLTMSLQSNLSTPATSLSDNMLLQVCPTLKQYSQCFEQCLGLLYGCYITKKLEVVSHLLNMEVKLF